MCSGCGKGVKKDSFLVVAQTSEFRADLDATNEEDAKLEAQGLADEKKEPLYLYKRGAPGQPNQQVAVFTSTKVTSHK